MHGAQVDGDAIATAEVNHIGTGNTLAVLELLGLLRQSLLLLAFFLGTLAGFLLASFRGGFFALALFFLAPFQSHSTEFFQAGEDWRLHFLVGSDGCSAYP